VTRGVRALLAALVLAPAVGACARGAGAAEVKVASLPPTPKDVIDALLASSHVPLSVDPSCAGAGTQPRDATIGRYLSGFLAELSNAEARNAIETSSEEQGAVWICKVLIRHAQGEDVWRWGVQFSVRRADGVVLPDSFRCLGAG
jgi:hypothetical protein